MSLGIQLGGSGGSSTVGFGADGGPPTKYVKHGAIISQDAFQGLGFPSSGRGLYFPSIINVGELVRNGKITLHADLAGAEYLLYASEDHGSVGGIWVAKAQSITGPWTEVDGGGTEGQVVEYTTTGNGQETPEVFWSPKLQKLVMISHNQSMGRQQSSFVLTSTDGKTWTDGGSLKVLDVPTEYMSDGHTGYIRVHQDEDGSFVGLGLSSGTDNSRKTVWFSNDGQEWVTFPGWQYVTFNAKLARTDDYGVTLDDIIYHQGEKYAIGRHQQLAAAGGVTTPGQLWLFKLFGENITTMTAEPVVEVPMGATSSADENGFISPCLFSDNGRLYCIYVGRDNSSPTNLNTVMLVEFK